MTFLCPICNEVSSGKTKKAIPKKKGKTWRDRKKERSVMATVNLGFTCPCCKEIREMGHHNPFEAFSKMGKKKIETKLKKPQILLKPRSVSPQPRELTALSAESLTESIGFDIEKDENAAQIRVHNKNSATVSWDDATEVRRLILKDMIYRAAARPATTIQCFYRCWKARNRVRKVRDLALKKKKQARS
jgi:hypothetical protein